MFAQPTEQLTVSVMMWTWMVCPSTPSTPHTRTHTLFSMSLSLYHCISLFLPPSPALPVSMYHVLSLSLCLSIARSLSCKHTHTRTSNIHKRAKHSHAHTHTLSLAPSVRTFSLSLTHTLTHSHTHIHTHVCTHLCACTPPHILITHRTPG